MSRLFHSLPFVHSDARRKANIAFLSNTKDVMMEQSWKLLREAQKICEMTHQARIPLSSETQKTQMNTKSAEDAENANEHRKHEKHKKHIAHVFRNFPNVIANWYSQCLRKL